MNATEIQIRSRLINNIPVIIPTLTNTLTQAVTVTAVINYNAATTE